jgi:alpha-glucoside transport system substrate-binding protein
MKKLFGLILFATLLVMLVPVVVSAQEPVTCQEEVVVQKDDWLSKYADKYLGNARAWPAIFHLHNQAAAADPTKFPDKIDNPDLIEVGWTICIPATEQATSFLTTYSQGIDCKGAAAGDQVSVLYQWSGTEEEKFNMVVKPLVDACGISIVAQSSRDDAVLDAKAKSTPPDVVFWPKLAPLTLYTAQLKDLGALGADRVNYDVYWQSMGSVGGKWLGVPVKADIKTIIWYSPASFDLFGYTVPTTWAELDALVEKMVADGNVPWSMGMESGAATGWTGSDFIQDILLVQQGPGYVLDIIDGTVAYNDAGVKLAYQTYGKWAKDPTYTVGGATGTVSTPFLEAIYKVFSDPAEAMMVKQSGFAGGEVAKQYPNLVYGTDYDFFAVPGAMGMQGGADFMMAFGDSPAAKALVAYLTSPRGAAEWAKVGFDLSPNKMALGNYADTALVKKSIALAGAAGFTPDIGDTIPAPFGEAEWKAIVDYVNGGDLDAALAAAAAAQADALK